MVNTWIEIREQTNVAEVRRAVQSMASALSFDETTAGNAGLVVTEASRNVLKHAGGGHVLLRPIVAENSAGIEMLALDKGPGIADLGRCFEDGYSTAGTSGTGLGAIARLSTVQEIYSQRDRGTVLMAQVWKRNDTHAVLPRFGVGGVCVALRGEEACGDGWLFQEGAGGVRLTVADGLGHGRFAADAAQAAVLTARQHTDESPPVLLERIHGALRATRGAAVAVAEVQPQSKTVRFAGVGNIAAAVIPQSGPLRRLVSFAGTAGHEVRKIVEFCYPWDSRSLLLMHSDGLQTHWSLDSYPGLFERHPSVIAGVLYRDFSRGRDDVTVVVAREARAQP